MTSQNKNEINLALKGEGLSYETKITSDLASRIIALCLANAKKDESASLPSSSFFGFEPLFQNEESLADYIKRHNPKRNPDKILTFAGYLKQSLKKESFRSSEIKDLFREAGEVPPANFSRDFQWVIESKWLFPDPKKKRFYYITNDGMTILQKNFPQDLIKKTAKNSVRRHTKRKGVKSRAKRKSET